MDQGGSLELRLAALPWLQDQQLDQGGQFRATTRCPSWVTGSTDGPGGQFRATTRCHSSPIRVCVGVVGDGALEQLPHPLGTDAFTPRSMLCAHQATAVGFHAKGDGITANTTDAYELGRSSGEWGGQGQQRRPPPLMSRAPRWRCAGPPVARPQSTTFLLVFLEREENLVRLLSGWQLADGVEGPRHLQSATTLMTCTPSSGVRQLLTHTWMVPTFPHVNVASFLLT